MENALFIITSIVTVASAIANITPSESDNKAIAKFIAFVDALALNLKKMINAASLVRRDQFKPNALR